MDQKRNIIQTVKSRLQEIFGPRIKEVILFGSQAKNTENNNSDFDILIILNDSYTWQEKNRIRDICYDVSLDYEILIDSKIISSSDITEKFWGKHPLITDALKTGIYA